MSDLDKTCSEASDCVLVRVGDTCSTRLCTFDAINEGSLDEYNQRIAAPCAVNLPLPGPPEPVCVDVPACNDGTCAAVPDPPE